MSDDVAERLRKRAYRLAAKDFNGDGAKLAMEAADELTRLRAENKRLREAFEKAVNDMRPMLRSMISRNEAAEIVRRAARAALEGVTEPPR